VTNAPPTASFTVSCTDLGCSFDGVRSCSDSDDTLVSYDWSFGDGAGSTQVDVYRGGAVVATTANDGAYTDATGNRGGATYTYQVCEAGTSICSGTVTVVF